MSTPSDSPSADIVADVIVVGGGFSGIYALHKFRKLGLTVKLLEAGSDFGGVWHWNRYPGARVDSESPAYQFSIREVWQTWTFSQRFPGDEEIRRYFQHVDKVLDLRKDAYFNTVVEGVARRDGLWALNIKDGRTATCKYFIVASGSTHKIHFPDFKGLQNFKGRVVHSSAYPKEGLSVQGKKVGIIGSGATALQIVSALSKENCQLTNFIRTPVIALPMRQRDISADEALTHKAFYSAIFAKGRDSNTGFAYNDAEPGNKDESEEEREARLEELWGNTGTYVASCSYTDLLVNKESNAHFYNFWAKKTRARIRDPAKQDIVAPLKQPYFVATKRLSLEQDYYESLDRDNVRVVSLLEAPIEEITETGIQTNEFYELDILILATGFDSVTGSLVDLKIKDADGVELAEKWKSGVSTYLGISVPACPNMFIAYGPQAPTSLANGPSIIEMQIDWMVQVVQKMRDEGIESINAQPEAAEQWKQMIQLICDNTLFKYANSWYMGSNIPGKVREPLIYFGGMKNYNLSLKNALDGFKGYEVVKAKGGN